MAMNGLTKEQRFWHTLPPGPEPWATVLEVDVNRINDTWDEKEEEVLELLEEMGVPEPKALYRAVEKMVEDGMEKEEMLDQIERRLGNPQNDPMVVKALRNTVYCMIARRPTAGEYIFHKKSEGEENGRHVVCLHGTAMNETILRAMLARLFVAIKDIAQVTVIEGGRVMVHHYHPRVYEQRKFYNSSVVLREYAENTVTDNYVKLDEGVEFIEKKLLELKRPADILLGFSQGAMMINALALRWEKGLSKVKPPKGVILMCPPDPKDVVAHFPFSGHKIATRAMVVKGDADEVVAPTAADDTSILYQSVQRESHPEGHSALPGDADANAALVEKLVAFISEGMPPKPAEGA